MNGTVVIRRHTESLYLRADDTWTAQRGEARDFKTIHGAKTACIEKNLQEVRIIFHLLAEDIVLSPGPASRKRLPPKRPY